MAPASVAVIDMKAPFELTTDRLLLRAPRSGDAEAIFRRLASSEAVTRFVGWPRHPSVDKSEAFLKVSAAQWATWPAGPYLVLSRESQQLLGSTGFSFRSEDQAETGYVLAEDAWGQGYATEALRAMVAISRDLQLAHLVAHCHPAHHASIHVLEKCGFVRDESYAELYEFPNLDPGRKQAVLFYEHRVHAHSPPQAER
jgi:RimJ/RimL family protein N-acetyltransferase